MSDGKGEQWFTIGREVVTQREGRLELVALAKSEEVARALVAEHDRAAQRVLDYTVQLERMLAERDARIAELERRIENLQASHGHPRLQDVARIAELEKRAAYAEAEAERLRHGLEVEGDLVCPNELAAVTLRAALAEMPCIICETPVGSPPKPLGVPGITECPGCKVARATLAARPSGARRWRKGSAMPDWTHVICDDCWKKRQAEQGSARKPVRIPDAQEWPCCWCEQTNRSGIYVRCDPAELPCKGVHEE